MNSVLLAATGPTGASIGPVPAFAVAVVATLVVIVSATKYAKKKVTWNQALAIGVALPTIYAAAGGICAMPIDWVGQATGKFESLPQLGYLGLSGITVIGIATLIYIKTTPLTACIIGFVTMYAAGRSGNALFSWPASMLGSLLGVS